MRCWISLERLLNRRRLAGGSAHRSSWRIHDLPGIFLQLNLIIIKAFVLGVFFVTVWQISEKARCTPSPATHMPHCCRRCSIASNDLQLLHLIRLYQLIYGLAAAPSGGSALNGFPSELSVFTLFRSPGGSYRERGCRDSIYVCWN